MLGHHFEEIKYADHFIQVVPQPYFMCYSGEMFT